MHRAWRAGIGMAGLGAIALTLATAVGAALPPTQVVRHDLTLPVSRAVTWQLIAGDVRQPWRRDVARVDVERLADGALPSPDAGAARGVRAWVEHPRSGPPVRFRTAEVRPPSRFVVAFAGQGFRGTWAGEFVAEGPRASRLRFTETVTVPAPPMRVVSRLFFGPARAMRAYAADLTRAADSAARAP